MSETAATYALRTGLSTGGGAWTSCDTRMRTALRETTRDRLTRADGSLQEKVLHAAWRRAGLRGATVRGRDGHRYRVVYAGMPGGSLGPDFRDATLERDDGTLIHGDIEAHVRESEWRSHGHGGDRRYNGVVFHVALIDDASSVSTSSGRKIPLLILDQALLEERASGPAHAPAVHGSGLPVPFLDLVEAGVERFLNKSDGLRISMSAQGADQAIWEAALETLGYPRDKRGFRQLARRLPWNVISRLAMSVSRDELERIALWAAGFGPRPAAAPRLTVAAPDWSPSPGRPANRPQSRARAVADWAVAWAPHGPAKVFTDIAGTAGAAQEIYGPVIARREDEKAAIVGESRAREMAVNVLLPAAHAMASASGRKSVAKRALELFKSHPKTQRNSVEAEAEGLLRQSGRPMKAKTACEQQGLIHIYRMMTGSVRRDRQLPLI